MLLAYRKWGRGEQEGVKIYAIKDQTPGIYLLHLYPTS